MRGRRPHSFQLFSGGVAVDEAFKLLPLSWICVAVSQIRWRRRSWARHRRGRDQRACEGGSWEGRHGLGCSGRHGRRSLRLWRCCLLRWSRDLQGQGRDRPNHRLDLLSRRILLLELCQHCNQGRQCWRGRLGRRLLGRQARGRRWQRCPLALSCSWLQIDLPGTGGDMALELRRCLQAAGLTHAWEGAAAREQASAGGVCCPDYPRTSTRRLAPSTTAISART